MNLPPPAAARRRRAPAAAVRPLTLQLEGERQVLRARRAAAGLYVYRRIVAIDIGGLCEALVASGQPDASLQVREGREAVCFVFSVHATAALAVASRCPPQRPLQERRRA